MSATEELLDDYRRSDYFVIDNGASIPVRIGELSEGLAPLYRRYGVESSAFITAFNPGSVPASAAENEVANGVLAADLECLACPFLSGEAHDPRGEGPSELGFFCFGLERDIAISLGKKYDQNAVVWIGRELIPELVRTDQ